MRITHLLLIGILVALTAAAASSKNEKKSTAKPTVSDAKASPKSSRSTTTSAAGRSAKSLKNNKPGENRGKRTLYDFNNPAFIYPQIAARRAAYESESRSPFGSQSGYFNGQNAIAQFPSDYNLNYSPYPQYLEAPEPIIEIIIKDANETLPETSATQPIVTKNKKKKEKVHVFYVNYKKDQNNKLHLESPIASLNNDETEEEEEEEDNSVHYTVTPLPPLKSTTLRTIIHPDSEKYHSNSGIHVTFGSEGNHQTDHILEENDAESVQRQVVAVPVPHAGIKSQFQVNARNDFQGEARSPFSSSFFQSSAPWQHQAQQQQQHFHSQHQQQHQQQQQQLPNLHSNMFFKAPLQSSPLQQHQPQQTPQHFSTNSYHQKQPFFQPTSQTKPLFTANSLPSGTASGQQSQRKPLGQITQQSQPQSHYYANHNQLYQTHTQHQQSSEHQHQHQQHHPQPQSSIQYNQYYNGLTHKATQPPKSSVVFPTPPTKSQELPSRDSAQPYQPIKFRPTPASAPQQTKPTPIAAKLENTQYNSKPYLFQKQPQFIQHPTFTIPVPSLPTYNAQREQQHPIQSYQQYQTQQQYQPQSHGQTQQHQYQAPAPNQNQQQQHSAHQYQAQPHSPNQQQQQQQQQHPQSLIQTQQTSNVPQANSLYFSQNKHQQQQQHHQPDQQQQDRQQQAQLHQPNRYQSQSFNQQQFSSLPHSNLSWLDIKPSKETELLKSIPKFEQHITETVQNSYSPNQYQTQSQVIHDIPAPNLSSQQPQNQALQGHYIRAPSHNGQGQQQTFSNFVTASSNLQHAQQIASTTQIPQYGEATDGQKIMIVTPMPPNLYEQYQSAHSYQAAQGSSSNQQHSTQIINSIQPSQEQYHNFYQQPRQGQSNTQSQVSLAANNSPYSVSNYHSDVFKELEQRNTPTKDSQQPYELPTTTTPAASTSGSTTTVNPKTLLQLPDEVPDDLRQQLLSSGILGNADISVLDYDKVGDTALENLPAEHLQHFYGAGGGAQISASKKVLTVLKPNGDKVSLDEKEIDKVKQTNSVSHHKPSDVKIVRYEGKKSEISEAPSSSSSSSSSSFSAERQYNRYLPLKINGANFPKPDVDDLRNKSLQSIVVLAPVETPTTPDAGASEDSKEVKFLGGDLIKTLVKKPTKENFKRWLDKEARTDVEQQSVVLLVAKSSNSSEQEIFMYDITTGEINKLNGELSSKFVSVAEENASTEDLEHGSTLDPNFMETMMQQPSSS